LIYQQVRCPRQCEIDHRHGELSGSRAEDWRTWYQYFDSQSPPPSYIKFRGDYYFMIKQNLAKGTCGRTHRTLYFRVETRLQVVPEVTQIIDRPIRPSCSPCILVNGKFPRYMHERRLVSSRRHVHLAGLELPMTCFPKDIGRPQKVRGGHINGSHVSYVASQSKRLGAFSRTKGKEKKTKICSHRWTGSGMSNVIVRHRGRRGDDVPTMRDPGARSCSKTTNRLRFACSGWSKDVSSRSSTNYQHTPAVVIGLIAGSKSRCSRSSVPES
jgi:hypothetical protein